MTRQQASTIAEGEYIGTYDDAFQDHGSHCGYSDTELDQIRQWLRSRDLTIRADDRGLRVVALETT